MPAMARTPPRSSARSAAGTTVPTGAKMMAESSGSGARSDEARADAPPTATATPRRHRGAANRPVADNARAQQRRELLVGEPLGQVVDVPVRRDQVLGVTAGPV